jgi:ABC-type phosphate/phosphonate transport system ATPase subunit/GNAT superfamily N-acetyltransferase
VRKSSSFASDAQDPSEIQAGNVPRQSRVFPTVRRIRWNGYEKLATLSTPGVELSLPRSACVAMGDTLELRGKSVYVIARSGAKHKIGPTYARKEEIRIGRTQHAVRIKEIDDAEEFTAYQHLAQLHYRTHGKYGRSAVLIVRNGSPVMPKVLAYIELSSPFYFNKPRTRIVNTQVTLGETEWQSWDPSTNKKFLGVFVRIARCVVAPEFRGLGIAALLVKHAKRFARERWQVGGVRPLFIEISADMLKFVPFAERAGLHYIGETEGNLARVAVDIEYLTRNASRVRAKEIVQETACGIVDQQVRRMEQALLVMRTHRIRRGDLVKKLQNLTEARAIRDFGILSEIVSLPKPSYLGGLYHGVDKFVRGRVKELGISPRSRTQRRPVPPISAPFVLDGITCQFTSPIRNHFANHAVQQAFGINQKSVTTTVMSGFKLTISPGDIVLVGGPSGAGKSALLNLIAGTRLRGMQIDGDILRPPNARIGRFSPLPSRVSLIEFFGKKDVEAGLDLLSRVGLSDALLFLKKFAHLSTGQQYRAMLAALIHRRANVAIVDEFCSTLDPITASVVAHGLRKLAKELGITVVAASPCYEALFDSLRPDQVVVMQSYGSHSVFKTSKTPHRFPKQKRS